MARLVIQGDRGNNKAFELRNSNTIGRHPSQDVQVLDRLVSKEHATISTSGSGYILRDLESRNGTFVNNRQLKGEIPLTNGDILLIGSTRMVFVDSRAHISSSGIAKVTIAGDMIQSAIAAKISHEVDFGPAKGIANESDLRRNYEKLRMAYELQREIAGEVDLERLLNKILDSLFNSLKCDRCAVLLLNEETDLLEPRCIKTRENKGNAPQEIQISQTIISQVLRDKAAVLSSDASIDSRFAKAESIIVQGIRSTMCVPLIIRDKVLGIIHVDNRVATGAFQERDLHLVQGVAQQASFAIENSFLVEQRESTAVIREGFARLVSPILVEQLVSGDLAIERGGEKVTATVLFTDLRGFTAMSLRKAPQEIVHMLNEYFELLVDIVFEYEGTMDKFMGDGLMAMWGCPVEVEDAALKAVAAALKMQAELTAFNDIRRDEGLEEMHMGAGINTGELVAGYIGSTKTMSYTVVGTPVNLAARLCAAAKPGQVLVSQATAKLLGDGSKVCALDPIQLKGIDEPVIPYNVLSVDPP